MDENHELRHLTSQQIQDLLDHGLPSGEETEVLEHLDVCPRCRGEVEAWNGLFSQLADLPDLDPGPAFSSDVMRRLPRKSPVPARVRGWLESLLPSGVDRTGHLSPDRIQDYVEGMLPARSADRAQAHLVACSDCQEEIRGWERLFASLGSMGRLAPSPGFAARVMAAVRVPSPVPAAALQALPGRILAWGRSLLPRTRKGWAVVGGVASAPTITIVALLYQLFSRPSLSLGSLATYVYWKGSALAGGLVAALADSVVESVAVFRAWSFVETLTASPGLVGAGALLFSLLSAGALWVLYRNLIVTPSGEGEHARARV